MNNKNIALVGTGIMGKPIAMNLATAGHSMHIYARSKNTADDLCKNENIQNYDSPASAAKKSDIAITMVSDSDDVRDVILGTNGLIDGLKKGATIIDMSTISPEVTLDIASNLRDKGINMLDAPVSGGENGAINGSLSIMVGGEKKAFDQMLPIFQIIGEHITLVGSSSAGQIAKACNQILVAQVINGVAEAFKLAKNCGTDPAKIREALLGGFAYSKILESHGLRMLQNDYSPGFKAILHKKDLHIALRTAEEKKIILRGTEYVTQLMDELVSNDGGELDSSAIATVIE